MKNKPSNIIIAGAAALFLGTAVYAQNDDEITDLQNQINALQQQLQGLRNNNDNPDWLANAQSESLKFNFYGSMKWKSAENGSDTLDPHRWVLIPSYRLSENAIFLTELELEHGGTDSDGASGSRFDGYLELEQMYIDVTINEHMTWRSLGISLIPVGTINENHEPDQFYSVYRPRLYKYIIPSTWMEASTGLFGDVPGVDGLSYTFLLSSGLTSDHVTESTSAWNIRSLRPGVNVSGNDYAYTARLGYDRGGFSGSISTYQTTYSAQSGAESDMGLYDIEASYMFNNGLELIADYAWWDLETPDNIVSGLGYDELAGYRLEAAYHIDHGETNKIIPFIRLEEYDYKGSEKEYLTWGAMYKFGDNWEIKASYFDDRDGDNDEIQFGIGVQF